MLSWMIAADGELSTMYAIDLPPSRFFRRRVIKLEADHQKIDARLDYWEVGGITPAVLPLNRAWLGDLAIAVAG